MEKVIIEAARRDITGKKVGALRRAGKLPGVIYGHKVQPTPIVMDLREASRILSTLSQSHIVTIQLEGKEHATLVREKQRNYVVGTLTHVDFQVVSLTEKIRTNITIELTGVAPAIKDFNGVVITELNEVEVECYPQDLPENFLVDITALKNIGDNLTVKDLVVSDKVEILNDPDEIVVLITSGAQEITEEEMAEEGAEPEVIERGKKEEEDEE